MRFAARLVAAPAFLAGCLVGAPDAIGQSGNRTASDAYVSNIVSRATTVMTGDRINNAVLANVRAKAATDGINNFQVQNTSVSSGAGFSGSRGLPSATIGSSLTSKPFSNVSSRPTVSPYLRLFDSGIAGGEASISNYQTLVRPRLQQQRFNEQITRQQQQLNMRVQEISAQPDYRPSGSDQIMATGHPTGFGYTSHFYPSRGRRR